MSGDSGSVSEGDEVEESDECYQGDYACAAQPEASRDDCEGEGEEVCGCEEGLL